MAQLINIHVDKSLKSNRFLNTCFKQTFIETINSLFDGEVLACFEIKQEESLLTLCDANSDTMSPEDYDKVLPISIDNQIGKTYSNINSFQLPKDSDLGNDEERNQLAQNLTFAILSKLGIGNFHSRIFISYKRQDTEQLALDLYKRLTAEKLGFEVFLDTRKLDVGSEFMNDIRLTIAESDIFLLLDSLSYMDGVYTKKELYTAMYSGAGIIRIFTKDKTSDNRTFNSFDSIELINENSNISDVAFQELIHIINKSRTKFLKAKLRRINEYRQLYDENHKSLWSIKHKDKVICPMWGVPSSQRIEFLEKQVVGVHHHVSSFSILYDHWNIPKFYNEHIKWIVEKKDIQIKTLQTAHVIESKKKPIVFLSASLPKDGEYDFAKAYNIIVSLVEAVINRNGILVFGGHPTITPIIANMMNLHNNSEVEKFPDIFLYQSKYFEDKERPLENLEFPEKNIRNIDAVDHHFENSLRKMRMEMLSPRIPFTLGIFLGGVIKDGKCGVWEEYEMYCKNNVNSIAFTNTGTNIKELQSRNPSLVVLEEIYQLHKYLD